MLNSIVAGVSWALATAALDVATFSAGFAAGFASGAVWTGFRKSRHYKHLALLAK